MPRVIVIGGANVDIKGQASSSFVGATSNPGDVTVSVGGVGRNIAENLARLGLAVSLVTVLGNDDNGRLVREASAAAGVDMSLALTGPMMTGCYLAILDKRGEMLSAVNDMRAIEWLKVSHLEAVAEQLKSADMLVADCNLSAACLDWLCRLSAECGIRLLIEPVSMPKAKKLTQFKRTQPVFAVTPNLQQLQSLTGERDPGAAIAALHRMGFGNVVVHRGASGAVASDGVAQVEIAAAPVETVADVTGAGDAAVAGLVFGLIEGRSLVDAARLGQKAAALKLASHLSVAPQLSRDRLLT